MDKIQELAQSITDKIIETVKVGKWLVDKEVYDLIVAEQRAIDIEKALNVFCHKCCPYRLKNFDCTKSKCNEWYSYHRALEE